MLQSKPYAPHVKTINHHLFGFGLWRGRILFLTACAAGSLTSTLAPTSTSVPATTPQVTKAAPLQPAPTQTSVQDEFALTEIDESKWSFEVNGNGNSNNSPMNATYLQLNGRKQKCADMLKIKTIRRNQHVVEKYTKPCSS